MNYSNHSTKDILNKDKCKAELLVRQRADAMNHLGWIILSLVLALAMISTGVAMLVDIIRDYNEVELFFLNELIMCVVAIGGGIFLLGFAMWKTITIICERKQINRGEFRITDEKIAYRTVERLHYYQTEGYKKERFWNGHRNRFTRMRIVEEYVIYFDGYGRYVDSNDDYSIYKTAQPEETFIIVCTAKGKHVKVYPKKNYIWEK